MCFIHIKSYERALKKTLHSDYRTVSPYERLLVSVDLASLGTQLTILEQNENLV
jgi:hypothetical protein